jgi:5-deoxy-glucuronate isomerase
MGTHLPAALRNPGYTRIATAPQFGLRWLCLARLSLPTAGATWVLDTGPDEVGVDILGGLGTLTADGPSGRTEYASVGQRRDAFGGPPTMVYLPRSSTAHLTCVTAPLEAVVFRAQARRDTLPRLLQPDDVHPQTFGRSNWLRSVYPSIGTEVDADRLMMGETHTPSGNWSSYPPHKHDCERPPEHVSEEIYHFLLDPRFGFGLQTLWDPAAPAEGMNKAVFAVHDGESIIIPSGYHPVVAAPGFRMITVWAYAGDQRTWGAWSAEPEYANLLETSNPLPRDGDPV